MQEISEAESQNKALKSLYFNAWKDHFLSEKVFLTHFIVFTIFIA